jgi:peptidoglycan/LPS O-acetylase OafA/YrhL
MRFAIIELLRGFAAIWVFCCHFQFSEVFQSTFPSLHTVLKAGHLGVPMFFVLSGFCIAASAVGNERKHKPLWDFFERRFKRIYPPFWLSIFVITSVPFAIEILSFFKTGFFVFPTPAYLAFKFQDWIKLLSLAQVFSSLPGLPTLDQKFCAINGVYWTLAIEVQFYLAIGIALWMRRIYPMCLGLTIVSIPFTFFPASFSTGLFLPYWPQFAIGVFLFFLFDQGMIPSRMLPSRTLPIVWCFALAATFLAVYWIALNLPMSHFAFAAWFAIFLLLVESVESRFVAKVLMSETPAIRIMSAVLMGLGAMSYSLYLLHNKLQYLSIQVVRQLLSTNSIVFDAAVILLTCAISYLFYLVCERPFISSRPANVATCDTAKTSP